MARSLLDDLLQKNLEQYQVLWNERQYHSHLAHHLGSLVLLGADDEQVQRIYDNHMLRYSAKYEPSPHAITDDNWRQFLGDRRFCLAYRDYFNDKLPVQGDWKATFFQILLDDTQGALLLDSALCDLLHPIIHIEYALELNSRPVACEALTMTAVCSDSFHRTVANLKPTTNGTQGALQIIQELPRDQHVPKFDELRQIESVLTHEVVLLAH